VRVFGDRGGANETQSAVRHFKFDPRALNVGHFDLLPTTDFANRHFYAGVLKYDDRRRPNGRKTVDVPYPVSGGTD
jgi:hypothetical protein